MPTGTEIFCHAVKDLGPDEALVWLRDTIAGDRPPPAKPDDVSWPSLVEWSIWTVRDDRRWAPFRLLLTEQLDQLPGGPGYIEWGYAPYTSHARKAIQLRCRLIEEHGPEADDPVRDPAIVFAWVDDQLTLELPNALQLAENVRGAGSTSSREDIARLYYLRQPLLITRGITDTPDVTVPVHLRAWYESVESLRG